jgi:hypothetical protein
MPAAPAILNFLTPSSASRYVSFHWSVTVPERTLSLLAISNNPAVAWSVARANLCAFMLYLVSSCSKHLTQWRLIPLPPDPEYGAEGTRASFGQGLAYIRLSREAEIGRIL